jgi:FkbM family methyltransferase
MIHVHPFGLAASDATVPISLAADSSSVLASRRTGHTEQIRLVAIDTFLDESQITSVDLMKVNIEGGEYELLEAVLDKGLMPRFRDIQVQFHDFFPGAHDRMSAIRQRLRATHDATYQVDFVWENWRRR